MTSFFIGVCIVLAISATIFCVLWKSEDKARIDLENEIADMHEVNLSLMTQLSKVHEELKIKSENRSEADEKINALHNGDSVDNAINGLSKH